MNSEAIVALQEARAAEKAQALFYRNLTGQAEVAGDAVMAERLNGLLADEQHHLSRLTARLLEMGESVDDLAGLEVPAVDLATWEPLAARREADEVARYESFAGIGFDAETRMLIEEILETERSHQRELGGKWTLA